METDKYLIKLKQAGWTTPHIARKLDLSEEVVERRLRELEAFSALAGQNGYEALCASFTTLCGQYQLLGESLKDLGNALSNTMSPEEIRTLVDPNPEHSVANLLSRALVLRPYVAPSPEEQLTRMENFG